MNLITPFTTVTNKDRNPLVESLNYTNQDFASLKARMVDIIKHKFADEFNDFNESSLAMMLVELWAFVADQLSFKIDQIANELFIDTVTETANVLRLASLVGFKPTPPTPAKAMFAITLNNPIAKDIFINTPLIISFKAANGMGEKNMELFPADERNSPAFNKKIIVPAGTTFINNVVGIEGQTRREVSEGKGTAWQQIPLPSSHVLWGSISVKIAGNYWKEVDFFTSWQPMPEFRVEYLDGYRAIIVFGNNMTGLVPPKGAAIEITYRTGGGDAGNIISGSINQSVSIHVHGYNSMITCVVSNYTKGEGGYNGDGIDDIRIKLPIYMKTQNRAVTGEDYKTICENFASSTNGVIGKAAIALRNLGCAGNVIDIYLLAKDGPLGLTKASEELKRDLSNELIMKKMFSDHLCLHDGEILLTDIALNVAISGLHKQQEQAIMDKIYKRLANLLNLKNFEFGQSLKENDIVKVLADIKEVEHISASFTTAKSIEQGHGSVNIITAAFYEIIRPDNIAINFQYI